jgi:hypothetical protein
MNIKKKFYKIFKVLIERKKSKKLLLLLDNMYKDDILDEELVLNLIKGLVIIFYIDSHFYELYYEILHYFYNNTDDVFKNKIINTIKYIDLSKQFILDDIIIDKIIINTNNFFIQSLKVNIITIFNIWSFIIKEIHKTKLSSENTVMDISINYQEDLQSYHLLILNHLRYYS